MRPPNTERERCRAKARQWVFGLFASLVILFVAVIAMEVSLQAFASSKTASESTRCVAGIASLWNAIDQARGTLARTELPEEEAVLAFRNSLEIAWSHYDAIRQACSLNPSHVQTLDALERLRYAEETTVRRESSELGSLRRHARELFERNVRGWVSSNYATGQ